MRHTTNRNGRVLWRGHSRIDGSPIVVIITGFENASSNEKTGDMLQTWIIRQDRNPMEAVNDGSDYAICGDCPLRGKVEIVTDDYGRLRPVNRMRGCYVKVFQAPYQVWECYTNGKGYDDMDDEAWDIVSRSWVRLGSYGDVAAVPFDVMNRLAQASKGYTGYTHQWRDGENWRFKRIAMASCETAADSSLAQRRGWRTFRTANVGDDDVLNGEFRCPASVEAGKRLTCEDCRACHGTDRVKGDTQQASVMITAHGSPSVKSSYKKALNVFSV